MPPKTESGTIAMFIYPVEDLEPTLVAHIANQRTSSPCILKIMSIFLCNRELFLKKHFCKSLHSPLSELSSSIGRLLCNLLTKYVLRHFYDKQR